MLTLEERFALYQESIRELNLKALDLFSTQMMDPLTMMMPKFISVEWKTIRGWPEEKAHQFFDEQNIPRIYGSDP